MDLDENVNAPVEVVADPVAPVEEPAVEVTPAVEEVPAVEATPAVETETPVVEEVQQ